MEKKHKLYRVRWEIDVVSDTPENAAKEAREAQTNKETWATIFHVYDDDGDEKRIDLHDLDSTDIEG